MIARDTASYERQLSAFRLAYSKAGSITSIGLVLAGVGLDYFSYPEWLTEFFLLRLLVACLTLGILMLLYTRVGAQQVRVLTMTWLVLPQVMIAWMIWLTSGVDSIYFVGLHLAMYAVGIILPITLFEGIGFGVLTLFQTREQCVFPRPCGPDVATQPFVRQMLAAGGRRPGGRRPRPRLRAGWLG